MSTSDIAEIFEQGRKGGGDSVPDVNKTINFLKYIIPEGKAKSKCKMGLILFLFHSGLRDNLILTVLYQPRHLGHCFQI